MGKIRGLGCIEVTTWFLAVSQYAFASWLIRSCAPCAVGPDMLPGSCVIGSPQWTTVVLHPAMFSRYQAPPLLPGMAHEKYIEGATWLPLPARIINRVPTSRNMS